MYMLRFFSSLTVHKPFYDTSPGYRHRVKNAADLRNMKKDLPGTFQSGSSLVLDTAGARARRFSQGAGGGGGGAKGRRQSRSEGGGTKRPASSGKKTTTRKDGAVDLKASGASLGSELSSSRDSVASLGKKKTGMPPKTSSMRIQLKDKGGAKDPGSSLPSSRPQSKVMTSSILITVVEED